jgi:hypothetical protein
LYPLAQILLMVLKYPMYNYVYATGLLAGDSFTHLSYLRLASKMPAFFISKNAKG